MPRKEKGYYFNTLIIETHIWEHTLILAERYEMGQFLYAVIVRFILIVTDLQNLPFSSFKGTRKFVFQ
jgi:hypothetical protein